MQAQLLRLHQAHGALRGHPQHSDGELEKVFVLYCPATTPNNEEFTGISVIRPRPWRPCRAAKTNDCKVQDEISRRGLLLVHDLYVSICFIKLTSFKLTQYFLIIKLLPLYLQACVKSHVFVLNGVIESIFNCVKMFSQSYLFLFCQVLECGEEKVLTLTEVERIKALAAQLVKLLRVQKNSSLPVSQLLTEYSKTFGYGLRLQDYDASSLPALLAKLCHVVKVKSLVFLLVTFHCFRSCCCKSSKYKNPFYYGSLICFRYETLLASSETK